MLVKSRMELFFCHYGSEISKLLCNLILDFYVTIRRVFLLLLFYFQDICISGTPS